MWNWHSHKSTHTYRHTQTRTRTLNLRTRVVTLSSALRTFSQRAHAHPQSFAFTEKRDMQKLKGFFFSAFVQTTKHAVGHVFNCPHRGGAHPGGHSRMHRGGHGAVTVAHSDSGSVLCSGRRSLRLEQKYKTRTFFFSLHWNLELPLLGQSTRSLWEIWLVLRGDLSNVDLLSCHDKAPTHCRPIADLFIQV